MFASIELAARIERAEVGLIRHCMDAIAVRRPQDRTFATEIAGGLAAWGGEHAPFNKVAGLGFGGMPDEAELAAIEEEFARRGTSLSVELSNLAEPELGAFLTGRGYVLRGFENVLGLALPASPIDTDPAVTIAPPPDAGREEWIARWVDVVVEGFATPDAQGIAAHVEFPSEILADALRDMSAAEGMQLFLAELDGTVAGGASIHLGESIAHLCGAATLPAWRRRGVQTALLAGRLQIAAARGMELAVMITSPGSKSQQNAQRLGFSLLYDRAILVREPDAG